MQRKNSSYEGIFEKWEIETARYWAKRFMNTKDDDEEDLFHECLLMWLGIRENQDIRMRKNYISKILRNFLLNRKKRRNRAKRRTIYESQSLDSPITLENSHTLHDILGKADNLLDKRILHLDYQQVFKKLSPKHQVICEQIIHRDFFIDDICKELKKHPATVYRYIKQIRHIFEKEGFTNC